jgi:isopentenyl-diphosphate delta-isomerase
MTNGPEPFSKPLVTVMLESVVLLDDRGQPVGQHPKSTVHHTETPLHLAFSLYLFDRTGRLLMTRRALSKVTWPGVWTNSCCGHPMPGESMTDAVQRRAFVELGVGIQDLRPVLPEFSYRAQDASGIWENEICPVFTATLHPAAVLQPNRAEVMDIAWIDPAAVVIASAATPFAFSPWAVEQMAGMALLPDSGMTPGTERGRGPR